MTAKPKAASPIAPGFPVEVTEREVEAARAEIRIRLRQAILNFKHNGEIGRIHSLLSDLRALDYVEPTKVELPKEPSKLPMTPEEKRKADEIAARQAAAANDELMQKQNRETAKRESRDIAKEEGITS